MRFRPCIDIHNGKVKQIVGGTLRDEKDQASENFVSTQDAAWYASLYRDRGLTGGHVILLNHADSPYYQETVRQARNALAAFPGGLQLGGGVNPANAADWLQAGASHVIVTSYVFRDGQIHWERLAELEQAAGREHLVLDLSCRKRDGRYLVVTDRWQNFTDTEVTPGLIHEMSSHCAEFLVHAVDVEGKAAGIETGLASLLAQCCEIPVTYAGGIGTPEDLEILRSCTCGKLDFTVGSGLDLFGGTISFNHICAQSFSR